jgi:hypothetical protein
VKMNPDNNETTEIAIEIAVPVDAVLAGKQYKIS